MKYQLTFTVLAVASLATSLVSANPYQTEIKINYSDYDAKNQPVDYSIMNLEATRYFSPVDTTNLPYAEAAFLKKVNSFTLGYMDSASDVPSGAIDNNGRWAEINYYVPGSLFFVGVGIRQYKTHYIFTHYLPEYDGYYEADYETDWNSTWVGHLGITPIDGLSIWSDFHEHQKFSNSWNLNAKYVKPLAGSRVIGIESSFENDKKNDLRMFNFVADYYFTQAFSVGVGAYHYKNTYDDTINSTIRSRYFLTDKVSFDLAYFDSKYFETWRVGGNVRF